MKRLFSILIAVVMCVLFTSCDLGLKDTAYTPSGDEYFEFTLNGDVYEVSAKEGVSLPSELKLPLKHDNVKVVGVKDSGFAGISGLTKVHVPSSYERVGKRAFINCADLKSVSFISRKTTNSLTIGKEAFSSCDELATVDFSENVSVIDEYAFYNCSKILKVELKGIEQIKGSAFKGCSSLQSVVLSSKLNLVEDGAFEGCKDVVFDLPEENENYYADGKQLLQK